MALPMSRKKIPCYQGIRDLQYSLAIGNPPDGVVAILAHQQRSILQLTQTNRTSPNFFARRVGHPTGNEIVITSHWFSILESHPDNLVAGPFRAVPRSAQRDDCIPLKFFGEHLSLIKQNIDCRRVRLKEQIRRDGLLHHVVVSRIAWLRMRTDIRIRPSVESAILNVSQIVGRKIVAQSIALLYDRPQR